MTGVPVDSAAPQPAPLPPHLPTSPEQLLARLAELAIPVTTHRHPPVHTVEENRALRGALPGGHCKSLFLKDRKARLWLLVALEDAVVDLNRLHGPIGSARLSFGSPGLLWQTLGVRPGSVTPFALVNDRTQSVSVVLHRQMMDHTLLNYHPLENDRTTTIRADDLLRFIAACGHQPQFVDLADAHQPATL